MTGPGTARPATPIEETDMNLRERLEGLTKAVGGMEPGQREFCLAAIDELLDEMNRLRDWNDALTVSEAEKMAELARLRNAYEVEGSAARKAEAKLARLREALARIGSDDVLDKTEAWTIARNALKETTDDS